MESVFHINSYFLSNEVHLNLVNKISELGEVSQDVYVPLIGNREIPQKAINKDNLAFCFSFCILKLGQLFWPLKMWEIWKDFERRFSLKTYDVIHAHTLVVNGLIAYWNYRKRGTPYIVTVRNTDVNIYLKKIPFFKWYIKRVLSKAESIIFLSPAFYENHFKKYFSNYFLSDISRKINIIPSGIDDYWYLDRAKPIEIKDNNFNILFLGKLRQNKNLYGLLQACEILQKKQGLNITLDILGEGEEIKRVQEKGWSFKVNAHGFVKDRYKIKRYIEKAHVLAVISFKESFGLVYAEAVSQNTPIIYTKGQGFDGVFEQGVVGYAADPKDVLDIANKLLEVRNNYSKLIHNTQELGHKFYWSSIASDLVQLYKR